MEDRSTKLRAFYASLVCTAAATRDPRIEQAFAAVKRGPFAGPGPWAISLGGHEYVKTPDDDPAFLYNNTLVAADSARGINIGQPSLHALWLAAIDIKVGETVLQVGTGTGYYTAILAHLAGSGGRVYAYEIDAGLAARTSENVKDVPWVEVRARSGIADDLPKVDAIYVCAGLTEPSRVWLDALRPGGRLLFPLQSEEGSGGMLLLQRPAHEGAWPAKFISRSKFIGCAGQRDADASRRLAEAFSRNPDSVQSFRLGHERDHTCWFAGDGWWLSTAPVDAEPSTLGSLRYFAGRFARKVRGVVENRRPRG